jgi:hypothetical protein
MAGPEHNVDLVDRTLRVFQPRSARRLTADDARQISSNLVGFFTVLREWDQKARLKLSLTESSSG